jgi:hypothetical protein
MAAMAVRFLALLVLLGVRLQQAVVQQHLHPVVDLRVGTYPHPTASNQPVEEQHRGRMLATVVLVIRAEVPQAMRQTMAAVVVPVFPSTTVAVPVPVPKALYG